MSEGTRTARELGLFLRMRREHLQPMDVGLSWGRRRRAPGLRRAEVARLAGVTESWYTRLEQGKSVPVAPQLGRLCHVLRLSADETAYVLSFNAATVVAPARSASRIVTGEVRLLLANLMPNPAYVVDENWDFLAWNPAFAALACGFEELEADQRNLLWIMFSWPPYRAMLGEWEWECEARKLLGQYRASLHLKENSPRLEAVAAMLAEDADARRWWDERLIVGYSSAVMTFNHPRAGILPLRYVKLDVLDDPDQHLVVFMADSEQCREQLEKLGR